MKRVLTFLAILLLPLSVWAMTPITDTQLSDVTGQAGVSINFDFTLQLQFGQLGWGDSDGYAGFSTVGGSGGWVGIDSLAMSALHIWPRTDFTMDNQVGMGLLGPDGYADEGDWDDLKYLTIDVATVPSSILGNAFGTNVPAITAVVIGIPTLSMTMATMDGNVVLGPRSGSQTVGGQIDGTYVNAKNIQGPGFNQLLGQFYVGGMNMATYGGSVYIFAHGAGATVGAVSGNTLYGSGVTIALNQVRVSYVLFDTLSWGDIDGLYATGFATAAATYGNATWSLMGPGWVGLTDFAIKNLVFNGVMAIDVFTVQAAGNTLDTISSIDDTNPLALAGQYRCLVSVFDDIYRAVPPGSIATPTGVSIGFKNGFSISMGAFGGQVQLGPTKTLGASQTLGDIYVGGMTMTILDNPVAGNGSFVHILAH